jgi:hypothetical protein
VLVHLVKAIEHGLEILRTNGEHGRESDRRVHRVAAADPVPNSNMLAVSMPNFETSAALVDTATKCLATDFSSPPRPGATKREPCGRWSWSRAS